MKDETLEKMQSLASSNQVKAISIEFDKLMDELGNADNTSEIVACVLIAQERVNKKG